MIYTWQRIVGPTVGLSNCDQPLLSFTAPAAHPTANSKKINLPKPPNESYVLDDTADYMGRLHPCELGSLSMPPLSGCREKTYV
jgi:hypothetical protein